MNVDLEEKTETQVTSRYLDPTNDVAELDGFQDEWLHFLSKSSDEKTVPSTIHDKAVIEAYDEIERFNWTKEQYDAYVRVWMEIDREKCAMEQKYADGEAAGEAKGIEKGIEIGKAEGIELGKAEEKQRAHAKAIESAGKMLACGMSEVEIARFLDLDLAEIEELKERQ